MESNIDDMDGHSAAGGSTGVINNDQDQFEDTLAQMTNGINSFVRFDRHTHCYYDENGLILNSAHSGDEGSSSDTSNRTRIMPTPFYFPTECYNSGNEQDSDDEIDELFTRARSSVGIQTDYNEDFPPLKYLKTLQNSVNHGKTTATRQDRLTTNPNGSNNSSLDIAATSSTTTEGTLQLVIQNFRHMSDTVRGPSKYIQNVPWRIMVMPRQHVVQKKGTQKCLGFFLQCCPDAYSESWSCQASAELRLISQKGGVPNFTRKTNHVYTSKENDWGYSCFMTWADILDESQGYIKEDKVVLEIHVKADPPKNILTHKEFKKKIQDYKRLADLQCQRGLIDKAIECNQQALKFCKDKDHDCKAELEAQKAQLIEMKLKQSIQRIEKGSDTLKGDDDSTSNIVALKNALGGQKNATKPTSKTKGKEVSNANTNTDTQKTTRAKTPEVTVTKRTQTPTLPSNKTNDDDQIILGDAVDGDDDDKVIEPNNNDRKTAATMTNDTEEDSGRQETVCAAGAKCRANFDNKSITSGHYNTALLSSNEFDNMMSVKCHEEDEELLPDQIEHFLAHLSEKDKAPGRLDRFSTEVDRIALPFQHNPENDEFLKELVALSNTEGRRRRKANLLCDLCLNEEAKNVKRETSEFGCQTEFAKRPRKYGITDPEKVTKQTSQTNTDEWAADINKTSNTLTAPTPTLPVRRKKAISNKKVQSQNIQSSNQQHRLDEKWQIPPFAPKASPRSQNFTVADFEAAINASDNNILPADMLTATIGGKHPLGLINPNLASGMDMNLFEMATELDPASFIGKGGLDNSGISGALGTQQPTNILSRQHIEEWLRCSNSGSLGLGAIPQTLPFETVDDQAQTIDLSFGSNIMPGSTQEVLDNKPKMNETATALSIIGMNWANARHIQQRVFEFVEALESHPNYTNLRSSIDRLLLLCGADDNGSHVLTDETNSVVSVDLSNNRETDLSVDALHRNFIEEDPHDYMMIRELKQAEQMLSSKLNAILVQLHQTKLSDIVEKVETKIKGLEDHFRETSTSLEATKSNEAQIAKQLVETQRSLHSVNEKYDKLLQQLKDRKNEIKRLEKKAKSEAQLSTENTELHERMELLKKELSQAQRQLTDEQAKYKRDTQSLVDSKKHLNAELNTKYSEIQKLSNQLEEKTQALKKNETQLANERKSNANTVAALTERAKKAEISLLEHKLEDGLRVLERAKDDCAMQIKQLEDQQKKYCNNAEVEVIKKNITEWENKREEVVSLIAQSKTDFNAHISAIKSGKQLSQLPKLQVPKPPPCPKLHPMPQPQLVQQSATGQTSPIQQQFNTQQIPPSPLPMDRKVITPPSARSYGRNAGGSITPQQHTSQLIVGCSNPMMVSPGSTTYSTTGSYSTSTSANVTPIKSQHAMGMIPQQPMQSQMMAQAITPIGVRPHNYQNGVLPNKPGANMSAFTSIQHLPQQIRQSPTNFAQAQQQALASPSPHAAQSTQSSANMHMSNGIQSQPPASGNHLWGGWGDQLNNINELFGNGRSFGPLGSDFGRNDSSSTNTSISSASRSSVPAVPLNSNTASVIGSGRTLQNASPSQSQTMSATQQQQQRSNGWSSFNDTWNASITGRPS